MAHTDACKFQVCQFVGKMVDGGLSLREAAKKAQEESDGIPAGTIRRWWAEAKQETGERFNNEPPTPTAGDDCGKVVASGCKCCQCCHLAPRDLRRPKVAPHSSIGLFPLHGVVPAGPVRHPATWKTARTSLSA